MEYFASLPQDRLANELIHRIDAYYNWLFISGRLARWRIAYNTYYGQRGQHNSSFVNSGGKQGELSLLMSNEYRNLVQHLLVLTQQSRTSLETVAANTDSKSKAQAYVAKGIIEYFRRDGKIDANIYAAAEIAMIMDVGWVFNEWDFTTGTDVRPDPETGEMLRTGELFSRTRTPLDVVIDYTIMDPNARDWIIVKDDVNKYDLAAQYPELADEITALQRDRTKDALYRFGDMSLTMMESESPNVDKYTFYHRKSVALPQGRIFQFLTSKINLTDGPIPYRKLPGNRICPSEMILSSLGYSNTNDLLALQDVMDALISAGVTNMTNFGVNNIWSKPAENFDFEQLTQGMNHIESEEKPEVLMLNRLPPEWFQLANFVIGRMEAISGINSVARGNTAGKDLSGAAMALLQSMAIQFNSGLTRSVNKLTEDCGNDIISLTQDFAKEKKLGLIIGANNRYMMKEYAGDDISEIQRVYCRQSNPLKDTTAGKLTMAQDLLKVPGAIKSASDYADIVDTGNLDTLTESDRNDRLSIDDENEAMQRGEQVPVIFTDMHPEHMMKHRKLFAGPDARKDAQLISLATEHYNQHINVWRQTAPEILQALGMQPLAPQLPPQGAAPAGGSIPGEAGLPAGASAPPNIGPGQMAPTEQTPGGPPPVNEPNLPTNPLTKQKWNPQTGGVPQ